MAANLTWLLSPYDTRVGPHGRKGRYVAVDVYSREIEAAGGRWSEAEIGGNQAIVLIDAPADIIATIVADGRGAVLKDQNAAESLRVPRNKPRLDDQGNIVLDGPPQPTKSLGRLVKEVLAPAASRTVPKRSGPNGTGTISSFTGADENPISEGGVWSMPVLVGLSNMRRVSNALSASASDASAWWNVATQTAPCETFITATTLGSSSYFGIWIIAASPGTSGVDGYYVLIDNGGNLIDIERVDNGFETQLGSTISFSPASGDGVAGSLDGGTIEIWVIDASVSPGTWVSKGTRSDGAYTMGYPATFCGSTSDRLDDFGGGEYGTGGGGAQAWPRRRGSNICRAPEM